jgi:quinol monooxygenase YgiN
MTIAIAVTPDITTLINILTVEPDNQPKLVELLRDNTEHVVSKLTGWISTSVVVSKDRRRVVIYSQWRDRTAVEAMQSDAQMKAYFPRIAALAAFESIIADVAYTRHA